MLACKNKLLNLQANTIHFPFVELISTTFNSENEWDVFHGEQQMKEPKLKKTHQIDATILGVVSLEMRSTSKQTSTSGACRPTQPKTLQFQMCVCVFLGVVLSFRY